VTVPVLVYRSRVDHVVEAVSTEVLLGGITSSDATEVVLEDSYHVATLDHDAPAIFAGSAAWIRERTPAAEPR
jgi:carboxylesterase